MQGKMYYREGEIMMKVIKRMYYIPDFCEIVQHLTIVLNFICCDFYSYSKEM